MGVFLAYFPTWLKFHELFRLGAYIHPFDFISSVYSRDLRVSDHFKVYGGSWEAEFGALKDFEDPFAFLTPAMQEGSALGGPFLPLECALSEVHHRMGLGSIWTIGLPLMPASIEENGKKTCYRLYAFPKHWETEILFRFGYTLPRASLAPIANITTPTGETTTSQQWPYKSSQIDCRHGRVAYHIGIKLGTPTGKMHPGWTTHLPGKGGLLCKRYGYHDLTETQFGSTMTEPALQDAVSRNDNGSHPQNLSPTRSLISVWPQVRFGSPVNLAEVDSADVIRWSPADIKLDSFKARIVPGVPIEVHGSPQPSQSLDITLKRKATGDLYHPGTPKKMKTAAETHLNLEGLDANDAGRLMGYAHGEILDVAATAGLLNPTHFEVGPSGTIGLTESGLMVATGLQATTADPKTFQNLERRRSAMIATEMRCFMDQGGFWENGHEFLSLMHFPLQENSGIPTEGLLGYVLAMYEHVAGSIADLLETAKVLLSRRHEPMTEVMKTAIDRALTALYRQHKGGGLSPATRLRVANTHPGRPRLEMAQYLVGIARNYLNMVVFSDATMKRTQSLRPEDAQHLARSLAQHRQLSTDIQRLLAADDDES